MAAVLLITGLWLIVVGSAIFLAVMTSKSDAVEVKFEQPGEEDGKEEQAP